MPNGTKGVGPLMCGWCISGVPGGGGLNAGGSSGYSLAGGCCGGASLWLSVEDAAVVEVDFSVVDSCSRSSAWRRISLRASFII